MLFGKADGFAEAKLGRAERFERVQLPHRLRSARDQRRCALAAVGMDKNGAPAVAQIFQRAVPGTAGAEARLRDERFFAHRVNEAVAAQGAYRGKGQRPAAFRKIKHALPRGEAGERAGCTDDHAAACGQAGFLRLRVGPGGSAGDENIALPRGKRANAACKLPSRLQKRAGTDERDTPPAQKQQIAAVCERIIQNGDSIFLDSSTTANYIAEKLTNYRLTVLTNSIQIINTLASFSGISLIMVGGNFDKKSQSFYGTRALEFVRSYHVDKAFFSCRSINYKSGVMDSNEKTSDIRRMIIDQSDRAYLCVDSSKFGANSFVSICNFDALTGLITDHIPSEEWRTFLSKSGLSTYAYDELDTAAPLASPAEEQQAE